ncbi:uncharacterized protein DFL_001231 [Arthrobotrys flagrans]|uniref:Uncharacterized protein n=1 Tax=Arthrobotrys flagrans TaxID=97331 RepID=A0A437AGI2_ARTFL|nr:hypothetical protein DFL_001231 [Arthrobotrys flagrans]
MQFTTILFSLLASTTLITAAPVPAPDGIVAGAITAVGVACAFQAEQCQKIGDGVKGVITEAGQKKVESAREDGGIAATLGDAIGNVMGGVKA